MEREYKSNKTFKLIYVFNFQQHRILHFIFTDEAFGCAQIQLANLNIQIGL